MAKQTQSLLPAAHFLRCLTLFAAFGLSACGMEGGRPQKGFSAPLPAAPPIGAVPGAQNSDGAIFQIAQGYAALHQGLRARNVGDLVTIVLSENIASNKSVSGSTARTGDASITPPTAGPLQFLNPNALNAGADASFNGSGNAAQNSTLSGALAVTIAEVRSNGTALVVGEKQMSLSQGEEWVQFAGIIRLIDVSSDNRISSSQVADARIIYSGQGAVQKASRPGWLSRFFGMISPF
jgi:flagellar L-ring protein precursor FlgH